MSLQKKSSEEGNGLESRVAKIDSIVTDQGNGGSYCTNCKYDFKVDENPSKYERCPGCDYRLVPGEIHLPRGGSDFD